jgi:hypothetical protein
VARPTLADAASEVVGGSMSVAIWMMSVLFITE